MAEASEEISTTSNGHSRTSSSSTEDGLVLSVAGLQPKGKRPNSGNNNSNHQQEACPDLKAELETVKQALKTKEDEVTKLANIRDELENEVQELTASLFEEAHKMVGEANTKAAASERNLEEAAMKIEGLETEVAALKDLVLTSTPSKPNRHLHPQISGDKKAKKQLMSGLDLNQSDPVEKEEEKYVDPVAKNEYMAWKKAPNLDKYSSEFLKRLFHEDLVPCLTFPNSILTAKVMKAVEDNSLSMSPLVVPKETTGNYEMPKQCALFQAPLICQFKVNLMAEGEEFDISQLARNRIAAACECIGYLRYICEGLVKAHHNEVYWEIVKRRKKVILAKLGYSPDED